MHYLRDEPNLDVLRYRMYPSARYVFEITEWIEMVFCREVYTREGQIDDLRQQQQFKRQLMKNPCIHNIRYFILVIFFLFGELPKSEIYVPTFRNVWKQE